jgi:hypothetical protein
VSGQKRTIIGFEDLNGKTFGSLHVEGLAQPSPRPVWNVICIRCGTRWAESHDRVRQTGLCRAAGCRKGLEDEQRKAAVGCIVEPINHHAFDPLLLRVQGKVPW